MNWLSWVIVIALAAAYFYEKFKKQALAGEEAEDQKAVKEKTDYSKSYQAKYLLTKNEYYNYKKLRQYADAAGLLICPKVRLLDIIEPRSGGNYRTLLAKIKSKHVDFVICNQDLRIKGVVELDDSSHDRNDRKERDSFVDQALTGAGYHVIHTRAVNEYTLMPITEGAEVKVWNQKHNAST